MMFASYLKEWSDACLCSAVSVCNIFKEKFSNISMTFKNHSIKDMLKVFNSGQQLLQSTANITINIYKTNEIRCTFHIKHV